ncbi:transient receptor potential cation channel, subfamily M isoform X4 [Oratosquilla oratoria]|uniref:transient receptor potential cation channel, subfamily M isoform X4 n=1 Tax=Oratosquilla oratoria TaxID=337810 RepID=UPI003F764FF8
MLAGQTVWSIVTWMQDAPRRGGSRRWDVMACAGPRWLESVFTKRECIKFIPSSKDNARCCCGQLWQCHRDGSPATLRTQQGKEDHWSPSRHTQLLPTDAYGVLEFQGGAHPTKAQYIRLAHDSKPEHVLQLLTREWGLDLPKLLITVQGGKTNFDLQAKLKKVIRKGLLRAAKTTGAWVFTGGTNTGVTRHVGEALASESSIRVRGGRVVSVGIAPWGIVERRQDLVSRNKDVPYHPINSPKSRFAALNSHHTFFLLVDNGTTGKYGAELILRRKLENYISKQRIVARGGLATPVVCVVIEGGPQTIRQVLEYVTDSPPVPVIVCDGTGRAADILAFVHKFASSGLNMIEANRDTITITLERVFDLRSDQAEKLFVELMQCARKKDLITVFRLKEGCELDQSILSALLHSQRLNPPEQLSLALTWNRVDIARSHVFNEDVEWPSGSLEQAMMDALVNDRIEFVKLLLEQGVTMTKFLSIARLEELYNSRQGPSNTLRYIVRDVIKNIPRDYHYTLIDIGLVINKLMGGAFRSTYTRRKFRIIYNHVLCRSPKQLNRNNSSIFVTGKSLLNMSHPSPQSNSSHSHNDNEYEFEYPFSELLVWAVLTKRQGLAMLMWQHGEEALAKALIAAKLYKALAHEAADDDLEAEVYEELRGYAKEFENLALEVLGYCYQQDDDRAHQLLTYELKNWSKQTCLSLAVTVNHRALLSHPCCQILLADLWLGGLRTRKNTNIKVMMGLLCPPIILLLGFRSREELKTMPQTRKEHREEEQGHSSDSESDTDSDDDNLDLRNENDPEHMGPSSGRSRKLSDEGDCFFEVDLEIQKCLTSLTLLSCSEISIETGKIESCGHMQPSPTPTVQLKEAPLCNNVPTASITTSAPSSQPSLPVLSLSTNVQSSSNVREGNSAPLQENGASIQHAQTFDTTTNMDSHASQVTKQLTARIKFYEFYNAPITKFWAHSLAFMFFLCVYTYLVLVRLPEEPEWVEWYTVAYISTLLLEKIREILAAEPVELRQKINVWSAKLWNVFDLFFALFFLIGLSLRLNPSTMQTGRVMYCVDIIYWYLRILEILSANKYLGPLVMMMGKMIKNMAYFVVLLLVVLMAFGVCRQSILYPYEQPHWRLARHIFYQPYFMLYGEVFAGDIDPPCGGEGEIPCHPGRWITPTVMSMYLLVANILLINLLIAVFNNIFTSVNAISHQVWMFQRFQVVMEFEEKPVFPPPLIIFSHVHRALKYCLLRWKGKPILYDDGLKLFLDSEGLERLHDFEEECVDGYMRDKDQKEQMSTEERVRVMAERTEGLTQRIEDMHTKVVATMTTVNSFDFHLKHLEEKVEQLKNSYAVVHRFMLNHVGRPKKSSSDSQGGSPKGTPRSLSQTSLHRLLEESQQFLHHVKDGDVESEDQQQGEVEQEEKPMSRKASGSQSSFVHPEQPSSHHQSALDVRANSHSDLSPVQSTSEVRKVSKPRLDSESSSLARASRERQLSGGTRSRKSSLRHRGKRPSHEKLVSPSHVYFVDPQFPASDSASEEEDRQRAQQEDHDGTSVVRYRRSHSETEATAHHHSPPKFDFERSVSSGSSRPRIQVIPPSSPPPIITLNAEYTSLADELETVCMARLSPPSSPHLHYPHMTTVARRRHLSGSSTPHTLGVRHSLLRDAEESDYQLMEGLIQRRMHRDSENLAMSLEDLCSIRSDFSDIEDCSGVVMMRSRRNSRVGLDVGMHRGHSSLSLDDCLGDSSTKHGTRESSNTSPILASSRRDSLSRPPVRNELTVPSITMNIPSSSLQIPTHEETEARPPATHCVSETQC